MKLNIAPALRQSGKTQTALADAIGVKKGFMSEILSGKKAPSLDTLIAIATALEVGVGDLFEAPEIRASAPTKPGLSEGDATPYEWRTASRINNTNQLLAVAKSGVKHPETYKVLHDTTWLSLLAGDILVVDLATPPEDGDIILIGLTDANGFNAKTLLRRFKDGAALSPEPGADDPVISLDTDPRAAWRATVKAVVRLSA